MIKILLIEDDRDLGKAIKAFLSKQKYEVDWFEDAKGLFFEGYDILIIDWLLKQSSGVDIIKSIKRKNIPTPIIMITVKSDLKDKLKVFELGVDDYITKPFPPEELAARVKAILNRYYAKEWIKIDENLLIDPKNRKVSKNGENIELTQKEFLLLEAISKRKGKIVNYDFLMDYVWDEEGSYETLKSHIYSIRKKLGKKLIKNVKGLGYKID